MAIEYKPGGVTVAIGSSQTVEVQPDQCELLVQCREGDKPVADAAVQLLRGGVMQREARTPANGDVRFTDLKAGTYRLVAEKAELGKVERDIEVRSSGNQRSFVGDGDPKYGGFKNAEIVNFSRTAFVIQIVKELPPLLEKHVLHSEGIRGEAPWLRVSAGATFASKRVASGFDGAGKVVIEAKDVKGTLDEVVADIEQLEPLRYTIWDEAGTTKLAPPIEILAGQTKKVSVSSRLRLSVNTTWSSLDKNANLDTIGNHFDDLTILNVFKNSTVSGPKNDPTLGVKWNDTPAPALFKREDLFARTVTACHAGGAQVLVGMAHAANNGRTPASDALGDFMKLAVKSKDPEGCIRRFAASIDDFVFGSSGIVPNADGLAFDIEEVPPDLPPDAKRGETSPRAMPVADQFFFFKTFYQCLADLMIARGKFVAIAVGEFGATRGAERSLDELQAAYDSVIGSYAFRQGHRYEIAISNGRPVAGMVLRPMAFPHLAIPKDTPPLTTAQIKVWIREIIKFALDVKKLDPSQFQILYPLGNGGISSFDDGGVCDEVLRPHKIGFSPFAHGNEPWDVYSKLDRKLNPNEAKVGTRGQPVQIPLGRALP